jgi:CYTH domain-containing protein
MTVETEHKYLVNKELWKPEIPELSLKVKQAYIYSDAEKTIRVRQMGSMGYITIKGKTTGASRPEFEYEIPLSDALEMIEQFCSNAIEKTRHYISYLGYTWEVDEFEGLNKGLIIAEIELSNENESYELPQWVGENVTADHCYANSNLSVHPFTKWQKD